MPATCESLAGFFDPCPLEVLAAHLRDGTWLDVRTDDGVLQRVRIVEIVVRTQGEDIVFRQEWVAEEYRKQQFTIDADSIWKVVKTNHHIESVVPHRSVGTAPPHDISEDATRRIVDTIVSGAIYLWSIKAEDWENACHRGSGAITGYRHAGLIVVYEMTNLSPVECCTRLGWKSQQPLVSARWKTSVGQWAQSDPREIKRVQEFRAHVKALGKLVDGQLAPEKYRRSAALPNDYTPVLL